MTLVFHSVECLTVGPVVLIVVILLFLIILHHHSLHDLQLFLKTSGIQSRSLNLHNLRSFFPGLFFSLNLAHISIKYFPLINLHGKLDRNWGLCAHSFSSDRIIHSLALSIIVIEFIS